MGAVPRKNCASFRWLALVARHLSPKYKEPGAFKNHSITVPPHLTSLAYTYREYSGVQTLVYLAFCRPHHSKASSFSYQLNFTPTTSEHHRQHGQSRPFRLRLHAHGSNHRLPNLSHHSRFRGYEQEQLHLQQPLLLPCQHHKYRHRPLPHQPPL